MSRIVAAALNGPLTFTEKRINNQSVTIVAKSQEKKKKRDDGGICASTDDKKKKKKKKVLHHRIAHRVAVKNKYCNNDDGIQEECSNNYPSLTHTHTHSIPSMSARYPYCILYRFEKSTSISISNCDVCVSSIYIR